MTFTKPRQLVAAALVGAVVIYLGARAGYGGLPPLPPLAGATLLLIAAVDVVLATTMRPRIKRRPGSEPVDSLTAARAVALAKASSMAGAIMGGVWIGLLAYLLPIRSTVLAAQSDSTSAVVGLFSAAALIAAGIWLEHCLRNPDEPEEPPDE
jgi:drug/metabolite transporter (DMT)-like permease